MKKTLTVLVLMSTLLTISACDLNKEPEQKVQTDEHGCAVSEGFSWCETKLKCLKETEEKCEAAIPTNPSTSAAPSIPANPTNPTNPSTPSATQTISLTDTFKELLAAKYNKKVTDITVEINKQTENHAAGIVGFSPGGPGNAGMFLAAKINDKWAIVFDGNGAPNCSELKGTYKFPQEILSGICD